MINVSNENSTITPIENLNQFGTQELENSGVSKNRNKINNPNNSPLGEVGDSTPNKIITSTEIKTENQFQLEKEKANPTKSSQKLQMNKAIGLKTKNKFRVKFKNDFVHTIAVKSYKKYNVDMSYNEAESGERTKCRCRIF